MSRAWVSRDRRRGSSIRRREIGVASHSRVYEAIDAGYLTGQALAYVYGYVDPRDADIANAMRWLLMKFAGDRGTCPTPVLSKARNSRAKEREHRRSPLSYEPGFFSESQTLLRRNLLVGIDRRKILSVVTALERERLGRGAVDGSSLTRIQNKPHTSG